jgi:alpha-L-arabinofuranosidase
MHPLSPAGRLRPLAAAALCGGLLSSALVAPTTSAVEVKHYEIHADATSTAGPAIDPAMYGVFFEDINHAADGGLYAELVQNRSFEFSKVDNASYTPLTAWTEVSAKGGRGTASVVDDANRLNERNRNHLRLDLGANKSGSAAYGVMNAGYDAGIALTKGKRYDFSVWARTTHSTTLKVALRDTAGRSSFAKVASVKVRGDRWTKYAVALKAKKTSTRARLAVEATGTGVVRLDMVSLFPRDTFKGRTNGLRKDLAEKIAALNPGFLRFPGGCLVNTGSHEGYDAASGYERARSYQWKDTVGPVETRATNANFWGYNQSYGLGYYEYFQLAEDLGALPVPVVPALVSGCGQNKVTDDDALLKRHIQDTLDLIEFANGPATSTWGRVRAQMGHPKRFGMDRIEVGNEENLPDAFMARFVQFRDAINAVHPEITVISNTGPDDEGATFDQLQALNAKNGVQLADEHYYNSPAWFLANNHRYDSYDRPGAKVWVGEYASLDSKLANALSEGAFMTGLERNADVVKMASYAPLLADVDSTQWRPDMIWFDNHQSWGSTSYEVQKLFMNNVGDQVVPSTVTGDSAAAQPITGGVGLSTWRTAVAYDDVKVAGTDGTTLVDEDFSDGASRWTPLAPGSWSVQDGQYVQSDTAAENTLVTTGNITRTSYDYSVKATKKAGSEGFLVGFGVKDSADYYWWNLGGFNNTRSVVEKATGGAKQTLVSVDGGVETGRTYDITVQVRGTKVTLLLDGKVWGSFDDSAVPEPFAQVVTRDQAAHQLIVKVVNAQDVPAETTIDLGAVKVAGSAAMSVISGDPQATNTRSAQPVRTVRSTLKGVEPTFTHTFDPSSVTFIRVQTR